MRGTTRGVSGLVVSGHSGGANSGGPKKGGKPFKEGDRVRRVQGAFYTPRPIVRAIVARCVESGRVLDPAVGVGYFLLEAGERLSGRQRRSSIVERSLFGIDINPAAVELARCLVWLWAAGEGSTRASAAAIREHIVVGDGLGLDACESPLTGLTFDAVIGNPPFVDSERLTIDRPGLREAARARFRAAVGNWDLSMLFVERAIELCAAGGRVGMVLPWRALASDSVAGLSTVVLEHRLESVHDWSASPEAFQGTAVPVLSMIVHRSIGRGEHNVEVTTPEGVRTVSLKTLRGVHSALFAAALQLGDGPALQHALSVKTLADVAHICDGATTGEAYEIRPLITQSRSTNVGKGLLKVVNTGTIDPGRVLWGERAMSYLGFKGTRPVLRASALRKISKRREAQAMQIKVVVAGLSSRLEAAVVPAGVLCGKSAMQILPHPGIDPQAIARYLNAPETTVLYRAMFGRRGFSAKSMSIGARQLRLLPCPAGLELQRRRP
jgi:hypothetical protein